MNEHNKCQSGGSLIALRSCDRTDLGGWGRVMLGLKGLFLHRDFSGLTPLQTFISNSLQTWDSRRDEDNFLQRKGR